MKKYLLMTIMLLATTCATIRAQQIEGAWGGMLREEGKVMPVLFRLGWHSTLDLPSQNARGIPVVVTERTIATLKLKIPRMARSGIRPCGPEYGGSAARRPDSYPAPWRFSGIG